MLRVVVSTSIITGLRGGVICVVPPAVIGVVSPANVCCSPVSFDDTDVLAVGVITGVVRAAGLTVVGGAVDGVDFEGSVTFGRFGCTSADMITPSTKSSSSFGGNKPGLA